jgi:RNA polymerase sigma factor (TIGR02999 family)
MTKAIGRPDSDSSCPETLGAEEVTILLRAASEGDHQALDRLFEAVYGELKRLARTQRRQWSGDFTLNTTALVNEAYLKMVRQGAVSWADRSHFYAVASRAMRQILVNYAERRSAAKRGGGAEVLSLDEVNPVAPEAAEEILALDEALQRLAVLEERQSRVVECRFFAGLSVAETAEVLGLSPATVKRDWALASAWLRREVAVALGQGGEP